MSRLSGLHIAQLEVLQSWSFARLLHKEGPQLMQPLETIAGKLSDSIAEFRKLSGAFLTTFLVAHNQSTEKGQSAVRGVFACT
jgi:hypothetical protein